MLNYENIGKFIQELRTNKGYSQEKLAEMLFTSRQQISKWERGVALPNHEMILQLCEILDITANEFFAAEKSTKKNSEKIENISASVLKDSNMKRKRIIIRFTIGIIGLLLAFFLYYFVSTYNKMKVYAVGCETEELNVEQGLFMQSNELIYFNIGKIRYKTDFQYDTIYLYYLKNGEKQLVYEGVDDNIVLFDRKGYNFHFNYNDLKDIITNLYIEFIYNEFQDKKTIHLDVIEKYANDKLFLKDLSPYSTTETLFSDITIPDKIKKDFAYNQKERMFIFEKQFKNYKLTLEFSPNNNSFAAKEESNEKGRIWLYTFFPDSSEKYSVEYRYIDLKNNKNNFSSTIWEGTIQCNSQKCPEHQKDYEYFFKKYKNVYIPNL